MASCSSCGNPLGADDGEPVLCGACKTLIEAGSQGNVPSAGAAPIEVDHRGIPLPARTRVGGIIIPQ